MCGGSITADDSATVVECEYCGTRQTAPKPCSPELHDLFNRANNLRSKGEFDRAEKIYEQIITTHPDQAEAYWGLVLCRYGIEYVDDPISYKKIPTCHRASFEAVVSDEDYKSAIANADIMQRVLYEEQAREIDRIQRDILALSRNEKPYDVFICYKETDFSGQRTIDSVIANDIYHQLTQEGLNVFYAAITLEGKLGQEYEPIIFAALNSAKVMLVIGTNPEYFKAVWVRNEWSRFLKIIKKDRSKLLIPCYKNMDAYDLPGEFAHLQAQDMNKVGFMIDIIRGIKKLTQPPAPTQAQVAQPAATAPQHYSTAAPQPKATDPRPTAQATPKVESIPQKAAPLLQRAQLFLEDGEWRSASRYCETVLDLEPQNAEAYLCKLMASLHVSKRQDLALCSKPLSDNDLYHKTLRFASAALAEELISYNNLIIDRVSHSKSEKTYNKAFEILNTAKYKHEFQKAQELFLSIPKFKNSEDLAQQCAEAASRALDKEFVEQQDRIYTTAVDLQKVKNYKNYNKALELFSQIPNWRDSNSRMDEIRSALLDLERYERHHAQNKKHNVKLLLLTVVLQAILAVVSAFIFGILYWRFPSEGTTAGPVLSIIIGGIMYIILAVIFGIFYSTLCAIPAFLSQKKIGAVFNATSRIISLIVGAFCLIFTLAGTATIAEDPFSAPMAFGVFSVGLINMIPFFTLFFKKKAKK